jgi:hypothetical protein
MHIGRDLAEIYSCETCNLAAWNQKSRIQRGPLLWMDAVQPLCTTIGGWMDPARMVKDHPQALVTLVCW